MTEDCSRIGINREFDCVGIITNNEKWIMETISIKVEDKIFKVGVMEKVWEDLDLGEDIDDKSSSSEEFLEEEENWNNWEEMKAKAAGDGQRRRMKVTNKLLKSYWRSIRWMSCRQSTTDYIISDNLEDLNEAVGPTSELGSFFKISSLGPDMSRSSVVASKHNSKDLNTPIGETSLRPDLLPTLEESLIRAVNGT
ncbi:hypothetical protein L6452_05084 [Arctium lappa]|uniref:Uncharacterized protein n=1 Tax=Arctium lappa TaxID=4217 RepID=A0ACB9EF09_ARCLA|nr:hypothetical protein L6452_05084 [Arctium lappa]